MTGDPASRAAVEIRTIEDLAEVASVAQPLATLIALMFDQVSAVVPFDSASVWTLERTTGFWSVAGSRGMTWASAEARLRQGGTLLDRVGSNGEIVTDLPAAGFQRLCPEHDLVRRILYAPMTIAGRRVGLIALYRHTDDDFGEADLRFVKAIGSQVGMAISFAALEAKAERLALLEERARLGANLHDGVLQILSALRIHAQELRAVAYDVLSDADDSSVTGLFFDHLEEIENCATEGASEILESIQQLRAPPVAVDIARALERTRERLQGAGIVTELVYEFDDLSSEVAEAIVSTVREAANNIIRHSQATQARIEFRGTSPMIELVVADNGVGLVDGMRLPDDRDHLGLHLMSERVELVGGTLSITSRGSGTRLHAAIPYTTANSRTSAAALRGTRSVS